jgi:2-keto-3-deoxy-6-phosphogluconate aldolase
MIRIDLFKRHLAEKRALKVIAGINNYDIENVKNVVMAAEKAGASMVDICANKEIFDMARELTNLPLIVSSIKPQELLDAYNWGADAIELGNFEALNISLSAQEILNLVKETISLIGEKKIFFSVTIPGNLEISEQIHLGMELEKMGIDLIQTEGSRMVTSEGTLGLIQAAEMTLANTIELVRNINIPVMTASGLTTTTVNMAFAAGASAVGVGSCINKLGSYLEMTAMITNLVETINMQRHIEREEVLI